MGRVIQFPSDRAGSVRFDHLVNRCSGLPSSCSRVNSDGSEHYIGQRLRDTVGDGGGAQLQFRCGASLLLRMPTRLGKPVGWPMRAPCPKCKPTTKLPRGFKVVSTSLPKPPDGVALRKASKTVRRSKSKW
jgi:hypothetical protein